MSKKAKASRAKMIANPGSGDGWDRGPLLEQVTRCLIAHGLKVDVALAKPKEKAIPIARRAVKDGCRLIIAMGGDDTIEAIILGRAGSKAGLGKIPVGTANNLAKSLGIPEDPLQACALIAAGPVRKLDLGQVKVRTGKKLPFFEEGDGWHRRCRLSRCPARPQRPSLQPHRRDQDRGDPRTDPQDDRDSGWREPYHRREPVSHCRQRPADRPTYARRH